MATDPLKNVGTPGQKKATRAISKFCQEHGHALFWIEHFEKVSAALKARDFEEIKALVSLVQRAGIGSFHDWFPTVSFPIEDEEYVNCLLYSLYGYWREMINPILKLENA
jgi:hypothetical protein